MCGRYALAPNDVQWHDLVELLGENVWATVAACEARYNIAPSTTVPIITQHPETGAMRTLESRWQFIPHWWKDVNPPKFSSINARSEEAGEKPLWRDAWRKRRCLIPATHWYEWQRTGDGKQPFALQPADGCGFLFAGLYSRWTPPGSDESIHTDAILTREAAPGVRAIHDRMPVILDAAGWREWLDPELADKAAVADLLACHAVTDASGYAVSTRVNSPRNQGPELLQPLQS
ncbi:MAG: SOS response-associated peptidase [Rhodanobacteraceae bacterium]